MKIQSWNINGVRAVYKKNLMQWIKDTDADMICLQETKAGPDDVPEEIKNLAPYHFYCSYAQKKGYSGGIVLTKHKPISFSTQIGVDKFDSEGRIIRLDFKEFVLFNIYFPNGGASEQRLRYKLEFYDYFTDYVSQIKDKDIIVCGDFNTAHEAIDLARPKENEHNSGFMPIERERLDKLVEKGFVDTFRIFDKAGGNYSWWDYKTHARQRNVGWRLDYFFVRCGALDKLKSAKLHPEVFGSDHCPVSIDIY
jgi:exodeoxyribonuclease-3